MAKDDRIYIRINSELKQAAQQHAQETGRTLAGLIEWLLRQELKKAGSLKRGGQGRSLKMNKQKIKQKIDSLWPCDVYRQTIELANKYTFSGRVITYIDATNGNIGTYWLPQNTYSNDPYEIVLCSIETPLDIPAEDFFETKEERERFEKSDLSLEEFLGDKYNDRLNVVFDEMAYDFELDHKYIEEQLEKQFG
jgi:hypothetical protein